MYSSEPPNGLELSRSADAGGGTHTLALASDEHKPHADSAAPPSRRVDNPHRRAAGDNLTARPPSRLQRVVRRRRAFQACVLRLVPLPCLEPVHRSAKSLETLEMDGLSGNSPIVAVS